MRMVWERRIDGFVVIDQDQDDKKVAGPFETNSEAEHYILARRAGVKETDDVNHPTHYTSHPSGVECITITRHMTFNLGNAIKYIWRAGLKGNGIVDLEKAAWYLQDEIARRKGIR